MLSSWQHSQQGSTGNHFKEGMTSVKKQSYINSRNISFSISNSKTQNSPYQVKTRHRTNDKARQPLLDRNYWSNTKWVQTITQRMSLQVRCVTRHTWITLNRNVLHQTMTLSLSFVGWISISVHQRAVLTWHSEPSWCAGSMRTETSACELSTLWLFCHQKL